MIIIFLSLGSIVLMNSIMIQDYITVDGRMTDDNSIQAKINDENAAIQKDTIVSWYVLVNGNRYGGKVIEVHHQQNQKTIDISIEKNEWIKASSEISKETEVLEVKVQIPVQKKTVRQHLYFKGS
jgi:hypothetical protein